MNTDNSQDLKRSHAFQGIKKNITDRKVTLNLGDGASLGKVKEEICYLLNKGKY